MRRHKMRFNASKKLFRNSAKKVHKKNLVRARRRGGFCL